MTDYSRHAIGITALLAAVCGGTASHAADIYVGPTRSYTTLASAVAVAQANDRLLLDAGVYQDQSATISVPLTIEGLGTGAIFRITTPLSNHKGILIANANLTVRNLTFDGARVTTYDGNNGAGIRYQAGSLLVERCAFYNNQNGILANPDASGAVTVRYSTFSGNGIGDGYTHAMYVNAVGQLTVSDSTFSATKVGHDIKSRALKTTIVNTVLDDGVSGSTSYAIDLPNGGVAVLDGLQITQGTSTQNPTMIAYGAEGNVPSNSSLTVSNSTFTNALAGGSTGVYNFSSYTVQLLGNTFTGVQSPLVGAGQITTGTVASTTPTTPATDPATDPTTTGGTTTTADGSTTTSPSPVCHGYGRKCRG